MINWQQTDRRREWVYYRIWGRPGDITDAVGWKGGGFRYYRHALPKQMLSRCEWGRDDYSLRVEKLPRAPPQAGQLAFTLAETD
ncbi:MAG: hypothetical protein ACREA0_04540 [bacterium]